MVDAAAQPAPDDASLTRGGPLPVVRTGLSDAEILERLERASRRGKMPGFHTGGPGAGHLFHLEVFGKFFDRRLLARVEGEGAGRVIRFTMRARQRPLWLFWGVVALSIWPGVVLTDSILATYFSWYPRELWVTCAWYLPLTVIPVPWMWKVAWGDSSRIAGAEARAAIGKVAGVVGGAVGASSGSDGVAPC